VFRVVQADGQDLPWLRRRSAELLDLKGCRIRHVGAAGPGGEVGPTVVDGLRVRAESAAAGLLDVDRAGAVLPTQAPLLVSRFGSEHVLYGSDHCWTTAPLVEMLVANLDARWGQTGGAPWRELVTANAQRFFAP
jgi:hypothetical protein